jgi:hypothetical protein
MGEGQMGVGVGVGRAVVPGVGDGVERAVAPGVDPDRDPELGDGQAPEGICTVVATLGSSCRLTDQVPVDEPVATVAITWSLEGSWTLKVQGVVSVLPPCLKTSVPRRVRRNDP